MRLLVRLLNFWGNDCDDLHQTCRIQCTYNGFKDAQNLARQIQSNLQQLKNSNINNNNSRRSLLRDESPSDGLTNCYEDCDAVADYCKELVNSGQMHALRRKMRRKIKRHIRKIRSI